MPLAVYVRLVTGAVILENVLAPVIVCVVLVETKFTAVTGVPATATQVLPAQTLSLPVLGLNHSPD